jgi:hypothetical protein
VAFAARKLEDAIVMAEAPLQAVRAEPVGLACRRHRSRGEDLDAELRKGAAMSADSRGRSEAGAAPSNCTEAASWPWPRSDDGSGWSGRCSRKLAVMIR